MASPIQNQVRLPLSVAVEVVAQGIRIRFGRSVITIMGVVLGIAFLMSILAGQTLKRGVASEEQLRVEANRMASFLAADMGPPRDRVAAAWITGPLTDPERRLIQRLAQDGLASLRVTPVAAASTLPPLGSTQLLPVEPGDLATDASATLLLGTGPLPQLDWPGLLGTARQPVVASAVPRPEFAPTPDVTWVDLSARLSDEALEKARLKEYQARFRSIWIIVISMLVTIIGISNAMLMSVTERFREIGTMKCLGALSGFVRTMFLIESAFMGAVGGVLGCLLGAVFSLVAYSATYGLPLVLASLGAEWLSLLGAMALSLLAALVLSVLAALYPAHVAASMVPATALRSNV